MKKNYLMLAAVAALFAACSSDSLTTEKQSPQNQEPAAEQAVDFDAYIGRGLTRAGYNGVIDNTKLKESTANFGVFGYYTDGESYSGVTKPNFFYNQKVWWQSSKWYYEPIKYWPNEFGNDAISDQVDKVTFFAYAPYVEVEPLTGVVKDNPTNNIISMTRNNVTGDPFIRYSATMDPTNSTDLCYGVAAQDFTSSNSTVNTNHIKKGEPYKNVVKPGTDENSKIKFDFKHALAQLKVNINANVSDFTNSSLNVQTAFTRIWVRSVTFEGITQKGALNLNSYNNNPEWYDINGTNKITTGSLTVYDGRKDGREAIESAANESPSTLNEDLIQSEKYKINASTGQIDNTIMGVEAAAKPLFEGGSNIVFAIPTGERMKVTIVYDVETVDPNLAFYLSDGETLGSTVENKITKTIDAFGDIKAGYCYTLNLHLGMRSVDFDAEVSAWQEIGGDVDLPSNVPTFAVANPTNNKDVLLPATASLYNFAVSGLTVNTTPDVNNSYYTGAGTAPALGMANASGVSSGSVTPAANDDTKKKDIGYAFISDATTTTNKVYLHFFQAPQPLNLSITSITGTTLTFNVNSALKADLKKADAIKNGGTLTVTKNGIDITSSCTLNADLTITLPATVATGEVYTLYIQSGDATAESATKTI